MHPADYDPLSDHPGSAAGHCVGPVLRAQAGGARAGQDAIACEQAVALEYNGIAHAALLASPLHIEELALGFSFTEGIIESADELRDVAVHATAEGLVAQVQIPAARLHALKLRHRNLAGRTGCGLCGVESLAQVRRDLPPLPVPAQPWTGRALERALGELRRRQPLHNLTGATHAAAWADAQGGLAYLYEDVGRHNALDKLIGRLLREPVERGRGFVVVSSRASFEMVQKTHAAGIGALVAVSAPTSLAVRLADEARMMLAGFARENRYTIYTHPEHLSLDGTAS
ncbi:formate dehydrogenase accessory sulfurtransferase FdhD [Castellaniella sp. S9]|uniref:formate dehydrogenase accessory sulfurtransferase FdhD n=1 Tax=Castellaniella sp. S9 TaxID=2993652 RepID=UPI0022B4AD3B|nr:formate dehydrogenase accessory sulfurtransferase FdhD [Castellaniella sp. S9]